LALDFIQICRFIVQGLLWVYSIFQTVMMSQKKNLDVLTLAVNEVMNSNITIMPVFEQDQAEKVVGELAEAFGGVIVE